MLPELNTYDWEEAFKYATSFAREDVSKIYGRIEGENDGDPWRLYGKLNDGRYFYLEAFCDYTGWGCQEGGSSAVALTKQGIINEGLTSKARNVFGLTKNKVGSIEIKAPPSDHGFTSIVKKDKSEKVKAEVERVILPKKINNPILGLDIEE